MCLDHRSSENPRYGADRRPRTLPRGAYTGAIGYVAPGRRARFNVAIRTAQIDRDSGLAEFGTGGGIVAESQAEDEWKEALTKSLVLNSPAPTFHLLETLRWDPAKGYFLLDRHLRRMSRSAAYFDFTVDSDYLADSLQKAIEGVSPRGSQVSGCSSTPKGGWRSTFSLW